MLLDGRGWGVCWKLGKFLLSRVCTFFCVCANCELTLGILMLRLGPYYAQGLRWLCLSSILQFWEFALIKFDHFGYMSISRSCTNLQDPTHCSYMIWFLLPLILKLVSISTFPFVSFRFRSSCQPRWSERNGTTLCEAPG